MKRNSLDDEFGELVLEFEEKPLPTKKRGRPKKVDKEPIDTEMEVIPGIDSEMGVEPVEPPDENMGVIPDSDIPRPRPELPQDEIDPGMGVIPPDQSHIPVTPDLNPVEPIPPEHIEDNGNLEDMFNGTGEIEWNIGTGIGEKTDFKLPDELKSLVSDYACEDNKNMANIALNNISGVKIVGHYFNNRGDRHEALTSDSFVLDGAIQSYNLILNAVLFASKALDETKFEEMSIEAILAIGIVPRPNDYFCFSTVDKRILFFTVKEIERIGYGTREVHKLTLGFAFDSVTGLEKIEDLMSKVVDTLHYDHESQTLGENGLLSPEDLALKQELANLLEEMKDFYDDLFLDPEYGIYNLYSRNNHVGEHLDYILYDPYVANFHQSLICFNDNVYRMDNYTPSVKIKGRSLNFFTALRKKENVESRTIHRHFGYGSVHNLRIDAFLKNILMLNGSMLMIEYLHGNYNPLPRMDLLLSRLEEHKDVEYPLSTKSVDDLSYIFSLAFYQRDVENMSKFEILVTKLLDRNPIDIKDYMPYFKHYRLWSVYEQFFIIPILVYVARKIRKGITKFK